jgi:hypothetical protein
MKTKNKFTVALGVALLLQALTSIISGAVLFDPLVAENDIAATMINVAQNQLSAHLSIFVDIVTAIGIVWLAVLFFSMLRKTNKVWATTAMAFYVLEAGILVISKFIGYAFIRVSESYAASGDNALAALGQLLLQVKDFSYSMHIIPFGLGAILFYYLLFKSEAMPSWIPVWGLVTVIPVLICVPLMAYGVGIPFAFLMPYVPFEYFAGVYILTGGLSDKALADNALA